MKKINWTITREIITKKGGNHQSQSNRHILASILKKARDFFKKC